MKNVRYLYLVRHGKVAFPDNIRRCIGHTELPLSEAGRRQAEELKVYFENNPVEQIFTSPLGRCQETAKILSGYQYPIQVEAGLQELDMGEWENVPLTELCKELESEPEQGESRAAGLMRFKKTLKKIIVQSQGDIVCVAHAGINCCYLSSLLETSLECSRELPQPYGGISRIEINESGMMRVKELGIMPNQVPDEAKCVEIWRHYHTPEPVIAHCKAVCKQALILARQLNAVGCGLDEEMIRSAALLHDVARLKPHHARAGAALLVREGYPQVAEIVRKHHNLLAELELPGHQQPCNMIFDGKPSETEVVYFADKLVKETQTVTLEERFAYSRRKCEKQSDIQVALKFHEKRYQEAKNVEYKINQWYARCRGMGYIGIDVNSDLERGRHDAGVV